MAKRIRSTKSKRKPQAEWPQGMPLFQSPLPPDVEGAWYDEKAVERVVKALSALRHTKGKWAGSRFELESWQLEHIVKPIFGWKLPDGKRIFRTAWVELPRKNGKGLYNNGMILTSDGWKRFGDLQIGDRVHTIDGSLTKVIATTPNRHMDCYRVTFGDGQSIVCDSDHQWTVFDRYGHDPAAWKASRAKGAWKTIDTPELAETFRGGARSDTRYSVRMDRVLERPVARLPLDPYLLGLWLGDGHTDAARITTPDSDVVLAFSGAGFNVRQVGSQEITYAINGGLRTVLRKIGVFGAKRVPESYLTASAEQRLSLLQGLMDTDGSVNLGPNTPRVEFTSTNHILADAALFLARSLGWKAAIHESRAMLRGRDCGPRWRVTWTAYADRPPFRLERQIAKLGPPPARPTRATTNPVVNVERVETVPTRCIEVAHPSKQYLAGPGLIPTHNSTLASGLALVLLCADGEAGAEVYSAAGSRDQAKIVFSAAKSMAQQTPQLAKRLKLMANVISFPGRDSVYRVLSKIAETAHGLNVSAALVDEVHVHKSRDLIDAIETGTGAREQPLVLFITTADQGEMGTIYAEKHEYAVQLAQRQISDPTFYGVIWAAEEADDPFAEATWRKANPGLGVTVNTDYLAKEAQRAKVSPSYFPSFQRLSLNLRVRSEARFLHLADWDRTAGLVVAEKLHGQTCYAGLDLASTTDIAALVLVFPQSDGTFDVLPYFWVPRENIIERGRRDKVDYSAWVDGGLIQATPGNVIDYSAIKARMIELGQVFDIRDIAYDRWGAVQLSQELDGEGFTVVPMGQGFASMSPPTKELERLVLEKKLRHGGNQVLRWMVGNCVARTDAAENVKLDKAKSTGRIDGVVALVMAVDRASRNQPSVYEQAGGMAL